MSHDHCVTLAAVAGTGAGFMLGWIVARLRRLSAPERDAGKRAGARPGARRTRT